MVGVSWLLRPNPWYIATNNLLCLLAVLHRVPAMAIHSGITNVKTLLCRSQDTAASVFQQPQQPKSGFSPRMNQSHGLSGVQYINSVAIDLLTTSCRTPLLSQLQQQGPLTFFHTSSSHAARYSGICLKLPFATPPGTWIVPSAAPPPAGATAAVAARAVAVAFSSSPLSRPRSNGPLAGAAAAMPCCSCCCR